MMRPLIWYLVLVQGGWCAVNNALRVQRPCHAPLTRHPSVSPVTQQPTVPNSASGEREKSLPETAPPLPGKAENRKKVEISPCSWTMICDTRDAVCMCVVWYFCFDCDKNMNGTSTAGTMILYIMSHHDEQSGYICVHEARAVHWCVRTMMLIVASHAPVTSNVCQPFTIQNPICVCFFGAICLLTVPGYRRQFFFLLHDGLRCCPRPPSSVTRGVISDARSSWRCCFVRSVTRNWEMKKWQRLDKAAPFQRNDNRRENHIVWISRRQRSIEIWVIRLPVSGAMLRTAGGWLPRPLNDGRLMLCLGHGHSRLKHDNQKRMLSMFSFFWSRRPN